MCSLKIILFRKNITENVEERLASKDGRGLRRTLKEIVNQLSSYANKIGVISRSDRLLSYMTYVTCPALCKAQYLLLLSSVGETLYLSLHARDGVEKIFGIEVTESTYCTTALLVAFTRHAFNVPSDKSLAYVRELQDDLLKIFKKRDDYFFACGACQACALNGVKQELSRYMGESCFGSSAHKKEEIVNRIVSDSGLGNPLNRASCSHCKIFYKYLMTKKKGKKPLDHVKLQERFELYKSTPHCLDVGIHVATLRGESALNVYRGGEDIFYVIPACDGQKSRACLEYCQRTGFGLKQQDRNLRGRARRSSRDDTKMMREFFSVE